MDEPAVRIADHYADLADHWADIVDSPYRTQVLWPALESMLPPLAGRRVLDAGCGAGVYAEALVDAGAEVVGVDVCEPMVSQARERVPEATFVRADLREPLDDIGDGSVDVVLCQHVFSHLPTLGPTLAEFARVLGDDGALVVSTHDPTFDYVVLRDGEYPAPPDVPHLDPTVEAGQDAPSYGDTERYDVAWGDEAVSDRATYYRRSTAALLTPIIDAGFSVREIAEPSIRDAPDGALLDRPRDGGEYPPKSLCLRADY